MYRLNLASSLLWGKTYEVSAKSDVEEMMHRESNNNDLKPDADWNQFIEMFVSQPQDKIFESMTSFLMQPARLKTAQATIDSFTIRDTKETYISSLARQLLAMPEYQMC